MIFSGWGDAERRSVQSVLSQDLSMEKTEIVAVSDFSNDEMKGYLDKRGVKVYMTHGTGEGSKISLGVEMSTAPIITFLRGGDLFTSDRTMEVSGILEEGEDIVYHHSSVSHIDKNGDPISLPKFKNIDFDLFSGEDDVPFAFTHVIKGNAAKYLSAVTCRRKAVLKYLPLMHSIHSSADIALLTICLEFGGKFIFDTVVRTQVVIDDSTLPSYSIATSALENEVSYNRKRLQDLEKLSLIMSRQSAKDVIRIARIYSRLILALISNDKEFSLGLPTLLHYTTIGVLERLKLITYWARANISAKASHSRARKHYLGKISSQPWKLRM